MNRVISFLKKKTGTIYSLKTKLIFSVLLLFILFILIFLFNTIFLNSILVKRSNQTVLSSIKQADLSLTYSMEMAKEQAYQLSAQVTQREDIRSLLTDGDNKELTLYREYSITSQYIAELAKIGLTNKVDSIYVYSGSRKELITSNNGVFSYDEIKDYKWTNEALSMEENKAFKWVGNCRYLNEQQWEPRAYIISLICRAHKINRNIRNEVYFGLNLNESKIYDIFKEISITPGSMVYLADDSGVIFSARDKKIIGENLNDLYENNFFTGKNETAARITVDRKHYRCVISENSATGWNIVVIIPESELFKEQRVLWLFISLSLCLTSVIMILIAYKMIVKYVDIPVMKLVNSMKMAEKGDFTIHISEKRKDEFGALYTGFNEMVRKIDVLVKELYQEKLLKREVELKYLQKMINPHFLYNTLDTVNWLAKENRLMDVSALTMALSNQYRTIFNRGQEYIPLGVCLKNIENYLFIHRIRYGGTFSYRIVADESVKDILVLNLILQPMVENALIHGIQDRGTPGGMVAITARMRKNLVCVRVIDNGTGMRKEKLEIIKTNMKSGRRSNDSGIKIIHQRLVLFYGEKYGLRIRSSYKRGTCVSFAFPVYEFLPRRGEI